MEGECAAGGGTGLGDKISSIVAWDVPARVVSRVGPGVAFEGASAALGITRGETADHEAQCLALLEEGRDKPVVRIEVSILADHARVVACL